MRTNFLFAACREKAAKKIRGELKKKISEGWQEKFILYFCHRKPANTDKKTVKHLRYRHSNFIEGFLFFSYFLII